MQATAETVVCIFSVPDGLNLLSTTLSPRGCQILHISPQSVARFRVQRIVIHKILHIEVQHVSGRFHTARFPFRCAARGPPPCANRLVPGQSSARVFMKSAIDLRRPCCRKTEKNRNRDAIVIRRRLFDRYEPLWRLTDGTSDIEDG